MSALRWYATIQVVRCLNAVGLSRQGGCVAYRTGLLAKLCALLDADAP
jgi:hypothetical protein